MEWTAWLGMPRIFRRSGQHVRTLCGSLVESMCTCLDATGSMFNLLHFRVYGFSPSDDKRCADTDLCKLCVVIFRINEKGNEYALPVLSTALYFALEMSFAHAAIGNPYAAAMSASRQQIRRIGHVCRLAFLLHDFANTESLHGSVEFHQERFNVA